MGAAENAMQESEVWINQNAKRFLPWDYTWVGRFTMPGKIKTKSNEKRWNRSRSPEIIAWENTVAIISKATLPKAVRKEGWVIIQPYFKDRVHPDLNNCTKSLFDGLKAGGIFTDDKYVASTVLPAIYGLGEKTEVFVWAK